MCVSLFICLPAAHALGFKRGGLVTLERELTTLKHRVLDLRATLKASLAQELTALAHEDHKQALTKALMEYEVMLFICHPRGLRLE